MSRSLLPTLKRRKKSARDRSASYSLDLGRFCIGLGTVVVLGMLLSVHFMPDRVSLNIGETSPTEIRASHSDQYVDSDATMRRKMDAAGRTPGVYDHDPAALAQSSSALSDLFDTVRRVRANPNLQSSTKRYQALAAELGAVFTPQQMQYLLDAQPTALDRLQNAARRLVDESMGRPIRSDTDDIARAREEFGDRARSAVSAATEVGVLEAISTKALRPNQKLNETKTRQAREASMRLVRPEMRDIRVGDVLVHKGDIFTQLNMDQCTALGLISPRLDLITFISIMALAAAMVFLVGFYIHANHSRIYESPSLLLLLAGIVILSVLGLKIFGQVLGIPLSIAQLGYFGLMMVVAAGMIIAVLLNAQLAVLVTALLSVQSGLIMNHELRFAVMTLISSLIGIYSVSNIRARGHLLRATLAIGTANVALVWILGGLLKDSINEVLTGSAWAVLSAGFAVGIFWFAVTLLERPFGILTHAWLLELSASDGPLLRELCLTAPGTYAHSIMVGNLAEAGAEAIGADSLFCRVASYYHDIGKIKRPHCFIENQHAENIHNKLNPSLSALIISSHVRDGLEIADQHKLPVQFKDVIAQHHGTSLIRYFYHQALAITGDEREDPVLEQHFRYDGPRPQTRESGIIMLADTVEAAARCIDKPNPARIQGLIETLIHDKLTDGQLDECDLTFKDIGKIQAAFTRILSAMLHGRIDYPDMPKSGSSITSAVTSAPLPEELKSALTHGSHYPELPKA
jgi:putative nucleotidyltransferase with HDIG domain